VVTFARLAHAWLRSLAGLGLQLHVLCNACTGQNQTIAAPVPSCAPMSSRRLCCLRASASSGLPHSAPPCSVLLRYYPVMSCLFLSCLVFSCPVLLAPSAIRQMPTLCRRNDYIKRRGAEPSFYHSVPTTGTCPVPRAQTLARGPSGTWNCVNRKLRYALCWLGVQPGRPSSIGSSSVCGSSRTQPAWLHGAMQSTRVRP
jgi:hypothetical protein